MSQFTKASELHWAWADWLEMCEGTKINVNSGYRLVDSSFRDYRYKPQFNLNPELYEVAIGIVDNRPVFIGDELYNHNGGKILASARGFNWYDKEAFNSWLKSLSWNPPKPKTAMVELLMGDIEYWSGLHGEYLPPHSRRFYEACRKTLENLKCPT